MPNLIWDCRTRRRATVIPRRRRKRGEPVSGEAADHGPDAARGGASRRLHDAGPRGRFPFVQTWAVEFPVGPDPLKEYCAGLLDSAAGGSLLVNAVEEMPASVQDAMIDLLRDLESARAPSDTAQLISGTTVPLLDRVAAGTFSERLCYRLNVIHLMAGKGSEAVLRATAPRRARN
jgi:hypothetical protein